MESIKELLWLLLPVDIFLTAAKESHIIEYFTIALFSQGNTAVMRAIQSWDKHHLVLRFHLTRLSSNAETFS